MFIHQDVMLPSRSWLEDAENTLSTVSNLGIAGVIGMLKPHSINDFEMYARYRLLITVKLSVWVNTYGRGNVFSGYERTPGGEKKYQKFLACKLWMKCF